MRRKLKALGLALLATAAIGAIAAQGAQAKFDTLRTFPAGSNAFLRVEADPTEPSQMFTFVTHVVGVACKKVSTTGATVKDKATEITGEPHYAECEATVGGSAEVKSNGCHYLLTSETDTNEHAVVHVICPAGQSIEISFSGCIVSIGEQTLNGIHYTNVQTGVTEREMHPTVNWTVEDSIVFHTNKAFACRLAGIPNEGKEAAYNGKWTVRGVEDNEGEEGIGQVGITYETRETSEMP